MAEKGNNLDSLAKTHFIWQWKKKQEFSLLSLHDINKKLLPSLYRLPVHASHNSKVTPYISEEYRLKYPLKHAFTISVRKKLSA
jgi:hypothetical protein